MLSTYMHATLMRLKVWRRLRTCKPMTTMRSMRRLWRSWRHIGWRRMKIKLWPLLQMKHRAISILVVTNPVFHLAASTLAKRWLLHACCFCCSHSPRKVAWKSVGKGLQIIEKGLLCNCWLPGKYIGTFVCQSVYVESDNVSSSFWMYCTWTDLDGVYDFCRCITHADAPYQLFLRIGANGRWGQLLRLYTPSCDLICWLLTESFRIPVTQGVACDEGLVQFHITV